MKSTVPPKLLGFTEQNINSFKSDLKIGDSMEIWIWIGIIILIIAALLGFSVMRGMIRASVGLIKWVIIILVVLGILSIVFGWFGWL